MEELTRPSKGDVLEMLAAGLERDIAARDNVVIGLYSEALVALAVGGELATHRWESWDVVAADGGRIQVKTSTAMSIGRPESEGPSRASWRGFKPGYRWIVETNEFEPEARWHADAWVLARVDGLDPFDHDAWSFIVVAAEAIQALGTQSTSLASLTARGYAAVPLDALRPEYERVRRSSDEPESSP